MMDKSAFVQIRNCLEKTQRELAALLGVSLKGIQSFEQGWRNIPAHVERQMLFLIALKTSPEKKSPPCWKVKKCSDHMKQNCPVWEFQSHHFCWMINGLVCEGVARKDWSQKMEICRNCKIFQSVVPDFSHRRIGGDGA